MFFLFDNKKGLNIESVVNNLFACEGLHISSGGAKGGQGWSVDHLIKVLDHPADHPFRCTDSLRS